MHLEKKAALFADKIIEEKACILFGAGVSIHRKTGSPGWEEMVLELLYIIINQIDKSISKNIKDVLNPHLGLLFNETFFQIMAQTLSIEDATDCIEACLGTDKASCIHEFLALCAENFNTTLLTPNFDCLVEINFKTPNSIKPYYKLHGSLPQKHATLRNIDIKFQTNSVFKPFEEDLLNEINNALAGKTLIVGGYGGMDIYDVMPAVFSTDNLEKIIWIRHPSAKRVPEKIWNKFLGSQKKTEVTEIVVDLDQFLKNVLGNLIDKYKGPINFAPFKDLLTKWKEPEFCSNKDWWKERANIWAKKIFDKKNNLIELMWARLANHLRIYNVTIDSKTRNLADEAYERLKNTTDFAWEAKIQAAYMGRVNGQSPLAAVDLAVISNQLSNQIKDLQSIGDPKNETSQLKEWLGLAQHHLGVALQTQKFFKRANSEFIKAIETREKFEDDCHYSKFQQYMNARLAYESGSNADFIKKFCDLNNQQQLADEMCQNAIKLKDRFLMRQYGEALHNIGFVYQTMAEDAEREGEANERIIYFANEAKKHYEDAAKIRDDLRDPRMIAQSLLRLGQSYLFLATRQPYTHQSRLKQLENSEELLFEAAKSADKIRKISVNFSKEEFRLDQMTKLLNSLSDYRQTRFPPWGISWLPIGPIAQINEADQEALSIRGDPARGWQLAVVTVVLDPNNQVLMTKLGEAHAIKRFGGHPWVLPGGKVEDNETPSQAAIRELKEETGLEISPDNLRPIAWIARPNYIPHNRSEKGEILLVFGAKLTANPDSPLKPNAPETIDNEWIPLSLAGVENKSFERKYKGIFPQHHAYWARLAQFELKTDRNYPRFVFYWGADMTFKPWLPIENSLLEIDSHYIATGGPK